MSTQISYTYTESTNYTPSSTSLLEISSGVGILLLTDSTAISYTQDFSSTEGFVYTSSYTTMTGSQIEQINFRPSDAIAYASYTNDENLSWGEGTLVASTATATAHDGYLDMTGGNAYVEYNVDNLASMTSNTGCIRFRVAFDYSGASTQVQYLIQTSPNTASRVYLVHNATFIQCYITNNVSATIYSMTFSWTPTQSTIYEFEVNWNSGNSYFFINGQLKDTDTGTLVMNAPTLFRLGQSSYAKFSIYDIVIFDVLKHSSNYTPNWTNFYETDYHSEDAIVIPAIDTPNPGFMQSVESLSITKGGDVRATVGISTVIQFYWSGSSWAFSNQTYAQASPSTDIVEHILELFTDVQTTSVQNMLYFDDSNTKGYVSNINIEYIAQQYSTQMPCIDTITSFRTDGLVSFTATENTTGSDIVKYTLSQDSTFYYYDSTGSSAWSTAGGIYSQSNLSSVINTYSTSFISDGLGHDIIIRSFFYSDDGLTTPELDQIDVAFELVGVPPTMVSHIYYGVLKKLDNTNLENKTIQVRPNYLRNSNVLITDDYIETTVRSDGYWEITVYYEDIQPDRLYWYIDDKKYITNFTTATNQFSELRVLRG